MEKSEVMAEREKLLALESARGVAAIIVGLFHVHMIGFTRSNFLVGNAYTLVDFFFVLSGFVIALNYFDRLRSGSDIRSFMSKRFWRLYPLHFATLLGALGIEVLKWSIEKSNLAQSNNPAFSISDFNAFVNNLFLLQAVGTLDHLTFNAPSWSISAEFWTYLIFGAVIFLLGNFRKQMLADCVFALLIVVSVGMVWYLSRDQVKVELTYRGGLLRCTAGFFLGVLCYRLYKNLSHRVSAKYAELLAMGSIIGILFVLVLSSEIHIKEYIQLLCLFGVLVISLALLSENSFINRVLSHSWLVTLGTLSYSIYMTHSLILFFVTNIMHRVLKWPVVVKDGVFYLDFRGRVFSELAFIIGLYAIVFCVSYLTYRFIEDRFRRGVRYSSTNKGPAVQAAQ